MAMDSKNAANASMSGLPTHADGVGVRIFTYPKVIFIFPTMIAALICGLGMMLIGDNTVDPTKEKAHVAAVAAAAQANDPAAAEAARIRRFASTQNILSMIFLGVFALNMIIMAFDFPRFTIIAGIFLFMMFTFFFLWLNAYYDLVPPLVNFLEGIYAVGNAQFYFLTATIMGVTFAAIWATRYLDYWEILPNEILHHHGPLSDLERYPTFNLKFDKEIPDVLEFLFLGSGRLVLHVPSENRSIVLDNVLFINSKEAALKNLMSRMEVRVTTEQETPS